MREAIRDWQFKRELRQGDLKRLGQFCDEGKVGGAAMPAGFQAARRQARRLLAIVGEDQSLAC